MSGLTRIVYGHQFIRFTRGVVKVEVVRGAVIRSVTNFGGLLNVFSEASARVAEEWVTESRSLLVVETNNLFDLPVNSRYVGTVTFGDDKGIHVYELG